MPEMSTEKRTEILGTDENVRKTTGVQAAIEILGGQGDGPSRICIAEHLFRKAIEEAIPCGIAASDLEGRQIYVNSVFCQMVGWEPEELLGATFPFAYLPQDNSPAQPDRFRRLLVAAQERESAEVEFLRKDGGRFQGLVHCSPLIDAEGGVIGRLFSVVDITRRRRAEETLRLISLRLIGAQESQRKLISQNLHDSIGGKLTGIKYGMERMLAGIQRGQEVNADSIREILSLFQGAIDEVRRISRNLHPSVLDDLGLLPALRELIREYGIFYDQTEFFSEIQLDESDLGDDYKILIYRVCQEAFTNAAKHGRASRIRMSLQRHGDRVRLVVQDDGVGFDLQALSQSRERTGGMGVDGMRERTELFGGSLNIHSEPGKGTRLEAEWPIL